MSKFSVKKPYTVVVMLIAIIVLGYVSFTRMTTDLLPDMSFPYAVVITTYIGASPSEVEDEVTRPVEQAMASVSNIQDIQSVSQENYSMVILEFSQTTDMDSVSLEMRESLDQISASWDDGIGSPIIMKINPDMIPVMIAAVEKNGEDAVGITNYVQNKLLSDIESEEGVASVSFTGEVKEYIQVILRDENIDKLNTTVKDAILDQFTEGEQAIEDAQKLIDDAKGELESGEEQLAEGRESAGSAISEAQARISAGQNELITSQIELENKITEANIALSQLQQQRTELLTQKQQIQSILAAQEQLPAQLAELETQLAPLEQRIDALTALSSDTEKLQEIVMLRDQIEELLQKGEEITEEEAVTLSALQEKYAPVEQQLSALGISVTGDAAALKLQIDTQISIANASRDVLTASIERINSLVQDNEMLDQLNESIAAIDQGVAQIDSGIALLNSGIAQMESARGQITSGQATISGALAELQVQQISGILDMADASTQITLGKAQIEERQEQLDTAKEELKVQKEAAVEKADLNNMITASVISQILYAQNFSMPAGYVAEDGIQYLVRVGDRLEDIEEIRGLILFDLGMENLDPIRLSDVADVFVADNSADVYAKLNGENGILMTINKQTGYSTGDVSDRLNDLFRSIENEDEGVHLTVLMDQGIYIDIVIGTVLQNLIFGAILAILILLVFLRDIRPTLVVAVSIPLSVMAAMVLMYFTGVTMNMISLSGLALGVGMLVDNSIVVIENIYRLRNLGMPARKAAVQGAKQMRGAIIASTLTTVCVFLPIVFLEGITRQLFVDLALTIAYSLLASLLIALSFVPMASAGLLQRNKKTKKRGFGRLTKFYGKLLRGALKLKVLVLAGAFAVLIAVTYFSLSRGMTFMPQMESTQTSITMTMPKGSVLADTAEMADIITERLITLDDVEDIGAMINTGSGGNFSVATLGRASGEGSATIYLLLKEDKKLSNQEIEKEIISRTEDLDCEIAVDSSMMDLSALGGSGVSLTITGRDMDRLREIAQEVAKIVEKTEGTENVDNGLTDSGNEFRITVNKEAASAHNLTVAQVLQQISAKIAAASSLTSLYTDTYEYEIRVSDERSEQNTRETLRDMMITSTKTDGTTEEVPLSEIASFTDAQGPNSITRQNQARYVTVSADVADGYNVTNVSNSVRAALADYEFPEGYGYKMAGAYESIMESMGQLVLMLVLALIFMYLIMVAQFQSFLSPFIVMFTVPLAMTGGFIGLLVTGMELSIIAMIGFVMLCGVIVNNGIVLVDYINQLRAAGMERRDAIVLAGQTRMRPIFMTALTTILGLLTMAIGFGMGSEMARPMAVVTIGGLLYGTFLTLFVIPCIYDILSRRAIRVVKDEELQLLDEDMDLMDEVRGYVQEENGGGEDNAGEAVSE